MRVRVATLADAAAIAHVHVDTWRTTYRGLMPDEYLDGLSYETRTRGRREALAHPRPGECSVVARTDDNVIIGFAVGGPERDPQSGYAGELYAIYILDSYQKQGVGRALTAAIASHLLEKGLTSMLVWVLADNPACRFYESLGGTQVGERRVERLGLVLDEIAYGWLDIASILSVKAERPI